MVMSPSKGASSPLAQSFLSNTATQAPQQPLPQIQAPKSLLPMGPMAMPQPSGPAFSALYPGPNMKPSAAASPQKSREQLAIEFEQNALKSRPQGYR